jgi:putative ABC transport system ATP-binding protein
MTSPTLIELDQLRKTYLSADVPVHAVRGISLEIRRGEFVAIMGASGSGKSTLMNILGALDRPSEGRYLLDGVDVRTLNRDDLADLRNRKLGFVFQGFNLLSRTTAVENVELPMLCGSLRLPAEEVRAKALKQLERVGLGTRAHHFPNQLSGGQQQRVAIARALVNEPELILADEPTGNLDSRTSLEIIDIFQQLNDDGMTLVMVTHEPGIARFCTRKILMRDGLVLSDIPMTERLRASEELAALRYEDQSSITSETVYPT